MASTRRLASTLLTSLVRSSGIRISSQGTLRVVTGTVRTCTSALDRCSAIDSRQMTVAPSSPPTRMSPMFQRSIPVPSIAPRKSGWLALSNMKFPLTCIATIPHSSSVLLSSTPIRLSSLPQTTIRRSAFGWPPRATTFTSAMAFALSTATDQTSGETNFERSTCHERVARSTSSSIRPSSLCASASALASACTCAMRVCDGTGSDQDRALCRKPCRRRAILFERQCAFRPSPDRILAD